MLGDPSLSSLYSNVFSDARVGIFAWPRTCYKSSPVHRLSYIECWSRQHNVRTRVNKKILSQSVKIAHSQSPRGHRRSNMQSGRHRLLTVHICQEEENDAPRALLVKTEKKEEPSLKKEDRRVKPQERRQESRTRHFTCTMFLCKLK